MFSLILFLLIATISTNASGDRAPIVKIPDLGQVEGSLASSLSGRRYYSFQGVPYAEPPVGKNRFKEPHPVKPWKGTWTAKTIYKCMHYNQYPGKGQDYDVIGDEDCLYLNIFSPNINPDANLDVIVFIHGGAFMFYYGAVYGPHFIMDRDVVFITFNYRLGPLGFLSTEDDIVPGNNGIKDQTLALQWIKNHIKYFGGNPDSITISGMSAGGASVHMHYFNPKSRGLFNRGVSQSGTVLNPWVLMEKPLEKSKKLAANLGCTTKSTEKMVDCLRRRPGRQIVELVKEFQPWLYNPFSPFGVVIDSWSSDPVLADHPINLIKNRQVADIPWIVSETSFEGLYPASDYYQDHYLKDIDTRWNELMPFILDYNYTVDPKLRNDVSEKIRQHFLGSRKVDKNSFVDFVHMLSERLFEFGIHKSAKLQASVVKSPIYFYYFAYCGADSWAKPYTGYNKDFGAAHGDDTSYVFQTAADMLSTESDRQMVKFFVEMFASYAKTGKPNVSIDWPPLDKNLKDGSSVTALKIDSAKDLKIQKISVKNEDFWESLPIIENEKLIQSCLKDEL